MDSKTRELFRDFIKKHSKMSLSQLSEAFDKKIIKGIEKTEDGKYIPTTKYECNFVNCEVCKFYVNDCEPCETRKAFGGQ